MMKPINILNHNLDLLGQIDTYTSFVLNRAYHFAGEFQLVVNRKMQSADKLAIGRIIMLGPDKNKTGIIRHIEISVTESGDEILTIRGFSLSDILNQRITIPPAGQAYDIQYSDAETVMKNYVTRNGDFTFLDVAPNQHRGGNIKWQTRYKNLADELQGISILTGIGWRIYPDFAMGKWVFDVYEGRDLSSKQTSNSPVVFSPIFGNVKSQEFTDSLIGHGNVAYVAGQGEGADREIVTVGNAEGLDRYEIFVDARDIASSSDLLQRGQAKLSEVRRVTTFQTDVLDGAPFKYGEHWDVGDIVTVQNREWGILRDVRVTEVTETYEEGGLRIEATFGESIPTLADRVKRIASGGESVSSAVEWEKIEGKPVVFPPNIHVHGSSDLPSTFQKLTDGISNLPYTFNLYVYGESAKYYPVHFAGGNQNLLRTIKIWRGYSELAPSDWYNTTHKGSLNLEWKGNYGGWGGAVYTEWIYENSSAYTVLFAGTAHVDNSYGKAFFLRGGGAAGAVYHIASDMPLSWNIAYLTYSEPTPFYNQDLTFSTGTNPSYDRYAAAPLTSVNTTQIDNITVKKGGQVWHSGNTTVDANGFIKRL